jgi:hypothetical protein
MEDTNVSYNIIFPTFQSNAQKNMNSIEWIIYQKWHDQLKEFIKIEIKL